MKPEQEFIEWIRLRVRGWDTDLNVIKEDAGLHYKEALVGLTAASMAVEKKLKELGL